MKRATVEKVRTMFWKDPFAPEPHKLIPVRQEDRDLLAPYNRGRQRSEVRESAPGPRAARRGLAPAQRAGGGARKRRPRPARRASASASAPR